MCGCPGDKRESPGACSAHSWAQLALRASLLLVRGPHKPLAHAVPALSLLPPGTGEAFCRGDFQAAFPGLRKEFRQRKGPVRVQGEGGRTGAEPAPYRKGRGGRQSRARQGPASNVGASRPAGCVHMSVLIVN